VLLCKVIRRERERNGGTGMRLDLRTFLAPAQHGKGDTAAPGSQNDQKAWHEPWNPL
jgi:hypothetical protein